MSGWLRWLAVSAVLALPLGADYLEAVPLSVKRWEQSRAQLVGLFNSPGFQRVEAIGLAACLIGLAFGSRLRPGRSPSASAVPRVVPTGRTWRAICLAGLAAAALAPCLLGLNATASTEPIVLAFGLVLGQAFVCLGFWRRDPQQAARVYCTGLDALVLLLALSVLVQPQWWPKTAYLGQRRWQGPWFGPNQFGILVATGMVLAAGRGWQRWRWGPASPAKAIAGSLRGGVLHCGIACALMAVGLIRSYSRGAWLGAALGLACLTSHFLRKAAGAQPARAFPWPRWVLHSRVSVAVILLSVIVLAFWGLGQTQIRVLRRALSASNMNDFSWRNRVAAYEGSLQVMAAKPWLGFGPGQTREAFEHFFRPAFMPDGSAILLNDFFETGMALGLPALLCLAGYVLLKLVPQRGSPAQRPAPQLASASGQIQSLQAVCRCGVIVLLVGFWFNRGLFCLALAAPFWVLLELAGAAPARYEPTRREDGPPARTS